MTTMEYQDEKKRIDTIHEYRKEILNKLGFYHEGLEEILETMYDQVYHQGYSQGVINEMRGEEK